MRRNLVHICDGKRVINWFAIVWVGAVVGAVVGAAAAATWFVLAREVDLWMIPLAMFASVGFFAGTAIRHKIVALRQATPGNDAYPK